jgi:hypothetical protein
MPQDRLTLQLQPLLLQLWLLLLRLLGLLIQASESFNAASAAWVAVVWATAAVACDVGLKATYHCCVVRVYVCRMHV